MTSSAQRQGAPGRFSRPVNSRPVNSRAQGRNRRPRRVPRRITIWLTAAALVLAGEAVAWIGRAADAAAATAPRATWSFSPASNTVTVRLTAAGAPVGRGLLARSRLAVAEPGSHQPARRARGRGVVRMPVPAGRQSRLLIQVSGPHPARSVLTITAPPALRVLASHRRTGGLRLSLSGRLRPRPGQRLCGRDLVSFAAAEVAVASSPDPCRARLTLTARSGERTTVPVTVPGLPKIPLYSFASPAGRAIYITVDDGWFPSPQVLAVMRRTHLPVTAFLIEQAAREHLPYWRAFVRAGGTVGDHTVSHPDLTKQTLSQATAQWAGDRRTLGTWLGQVPALGRPPYGAFNSAVEVAADRSGLGVLVGWSAVMDSNRLQTWDGRGLEPGEIVLLHWVPGLGGRLTRLLAAVHAAHLHPEPLTAGSFAEISPQHRSLGGD